MNRSHRRLRITLMVFGTLLVLAGAVWTWASLTYSRKLEQELSSLRTRGFALSMSELRPRPVPDEQNAAAIYMPLFNVNFPPPGTFAPSKPGRGLDQYQLPSGFDVRHPVLTPELRAAMRQPGLQQALAELRRASERPYSVFPVHWEAGAAALFPHYKKFREAAKLLAAQALIDADAGRIPQALDWLQVGYRMADHASQEPILVGQLVTFACRAILSAAAENILCSHDVTAAQARSLFEQLAGTKAESDFQRAMQGELAAGMDQFSLAPMQGQGLAYLTTDTPSPLLRGLGWLAGSRLGRPYWELEEYNYARIMGPTVEASFEPYRLIANRRTPSSMMLGPRPGYLMVSLLTPVMGKLGAHRDEGLANMRLVQVGLALSSYRHDHPAYPATLAALPWKIPQDPFSGKDFVYRRVGKGFQLYSIGPNLKDDGGHPAPTPGRRMDEGDIVWNCPG